MIARKGAKLTENPEYTRICAETKDCDHTYCFTPAQPVHRFDLAEHGRGRGLLIRDHLKPPQITYQLDLTSLY